MDEILQDLHTVLDHAERDIAAMAQQTTIPLCYVIMVKCQAAYLAFALACLWLVAGCTNAALRFQHSLVLASMFAWATAKSAVVMYATALRTVAVSMTTHNGKFVSVIAMRFLYDRMWFVVAMKALTRLCSHLLKIVCAICSMPITQTAFAMPIRRFADFCNQVFTAPTSGRIDAIASAICCSHASTVAAFYVYVNGDMR